MKIIKNIFMGLGVLLVLFVILLIFLSAKSSDFKERNKYFVKTYIQEISTTWDIESVSDKTVNGMLLESKTIKVKSAFKQLQRLGKAIEIGDMELSTYNRNLINGLEIATFEVRVKFENLEDALVLIMIQEKDDVVKTYGFYIKKLGDVSIPKKLKV